MRVTDKFVFFWGGPFSQWYQHPFVVGEVEYNCCEQFMMAMKAKMFSDFEAWHKIMAAKNPKEQKAIGRTVKNFNPDSWNIVCKEVVYVANKAKFSDPELQKILLDTGDREIVEASPYDKIWGVGLAEDNPLILDKENWDGTNWLGQILTRVREDFKAKINFTK